MIDASTALLAAHAPFPANVRAFTTLRHGAGVSSAPFDHFNLGNFKAADGDSAEAVARNRAQLARDFGLPSPPHWLSQVHGTQVVRFDTPNEGRSDAALSATGPSATEQPEPEADAAVTSTPGVVLAILTADCLPVVFAARDGGEVAAAHAGWKGLANGMLEATVAAMRTPASEVVAWLGPAAGPQVYEIGLEVYEAFVQRDAAATAAFVETRPGHWRVDLYALARMRLQAAGLAADEIHGGDLCTISDPQRFFSHRRDRRSGRMATVVWRV
ncbi:peptidoglycan editing factor PgeF [Luteimonas sp. RIT-PG2_3]